MGKSERLQGGNDHVCTPEVIWGPIHKTFPGGIALDPLTNTKSNVPAKLKITNWHFKNAVPKGYIEGNGFAHKWYDHKGVVFVNGSYSNDPQNGLKKWLGKAVETNKAHPGQDIICFPPVRTSGAAWQNFGFYGQAICFLNFRVQHDYEDSTSPFHQSLIYFGQRASHFTRIFETYGTIFTELRPGIYQRWPISEEHAATGDDSADEDESS